MAKTGYILKDSVIGQALVADLPPMSMGELSVAENAVATVITTQSAYTRCDEADTLTTGATDFDKPQAGRLRYTGAATKMFHVGCTFSCSNGNNIIVKSVIYKNGTVNVNNEYTGGTAMTAGTVEQKISVAGDIVSTAIHVFIELAQNDYIEMAIANLTDTGDITTKHMNLFAMEMYG